MFKANLCEYAVLKNSYTTILLREIVAVLTMTVWGLTTTAVMSHTFCDR